MQEDILHYIWKYKKLQLTNLFTTAEEAITILNFGQHNLLEGPDFFNAKVRVGEQLWAGNVEIHIKASDWYKHNHEVDVKYDNVVLHVVWEDDTDVYRKDNTKIPTLELKNYVSKELLRSSEELLSKESINFINCEKDIIKVNTFVMENWLERLYLERLERKSKEAKIILQNTQNDWEKTLFSMLLKNFGLNINGTSFLSISQRLDFSVVRKLQSNQEQLESLLFGLSGLLDEELTTDVYYKNLKKEYQFIKHKFNLDDEEIIKPNFFKLRPSNFPTIRLSQLAALYAKHQNLFHRLMGAKTLKEVYELCNVSASTYWDTHYVFGKESGKRIKKLNEKFIDLLVINTILPIKFCYLKELGKDNNEELLKIITGIKSEKNSIVQGYKKHGVKVSNALKSQAVIELNKEYCTKNKCLQCAIGSSLLSGID